MGEERFPVVIFDGDCGLCNGMVKRLIKADKAGVFKFAGSSGSPGKALIARAGLPPSISDDVVVVVDGAESWTGADAVLRMARKLPLPWGAVVAFGFLPRPVRNAMYRFVANHRPKVEGADPACGVPAAEMRDLWMSRIVTDDDLATGRV